MLSQRCIDAAQVGIFLLLSGLGAELLAAYGESTGAPAALAFTYFPVQGDEVSALPKYDHNVGTFLLVIVVGLLVLRPAGGGRGAD
jgi:hypothetical protein